jgi:tetratricopeptide (TPR) repeat protein
LLPVSNVVPIIYLRADHFLYIPSFGFALLTALLLDRLWGASPRGWARAAGPAAAAGLLAAYACVTVVRNRDWKDDLTLFGRSVQVTPYCREAHAYLGFACQEAGRYEEAVREYRLALAEDPAYCTFMRPGRVLRSLGEVRLEQGRWEEARRHYVESLQREPGSAQAYVGLGRASFGEGRYAEAVAAFQRALQLDPTEAAAHHNLGSAYLELGECEQAVAAYRAELALAPAKPSAHYCLGLAYEKWGRHADAAASFRQALALLPGNEEVGAALARVAAAEGAATGWPAADTKD